MNINKKLINPKNINYITKSYTIISLLFLLFFITCIHGESMDTIDTVSTNINTNSNSQIHTNINTNTNTNPNINIDPPETSLLELRENKLLKLKNIQAPAGGKKEDEDWVN
jgi:hypothetical protein